MNQSTGNHVWRIIPAVLLVALLSFGGQTHCQAPLDISMIREKQAFRITDVAIYANKNKLPADSLLAINRSQFIINPDRKAYKSMSSDRYNWFRFTLKNTSNDSVSFKFIIGNNQINEMELFRVSQDTLVSMGVAGRLFPFYQRPYPFIHFTYLLSLKPHEETTFIYFADCRGISYRVMLFLFSNEAFKKGEQRLYMTYGFFIGILLLASLFNLFLFVVNRERIHFAYSLYSLSVIFSVCALQTLDFQYLYPNHPHYTRTGISTYTSITCILMLWVMQLFLRQTAANSRFFYLVRVLKWVCALVPPLAFYAINFTTSIFPVKLYLTIYPLMLSSTFLVVLFCCIEKLLQGYKLAIFYLVAVSCVIISGSLMALGIMERKYYLSLPPTLFDLSMVLEALIICFGILFRYIIIKRERDKLEKNFREHQLNVTHQLITVQETERKRIAEDLHDELSSNLAAIKMNLISFSGGPSQKQKILEMMDQAAGNVRQISHNLMPPEFERTSLDKLLNTFFSRLSSETPVIFNYHSSGQDHRFDKEQELVIYRILMELAHNIIKHSGATEATIQLIYYEENLEIMTEDNGKGIEQGEADGIGLKNVRSRVNYLSGTIRIDTGPKGTTIMIQIPYKKLLNA